MSYLVTAPFDNLAITTATDVFHLTLASNKAVTPIEMTLGNFSDLGDAAEEVLRIGVYRGVTGGSGGTALTEAIPDANNTSTIGTAVLANNTTISTGGTLLEVITWNIRMPLLWCPVPEARYAFHSGTSPIAFRLLAAPADSISVSGTIKFFEGV